MDRRLATTVLKVRHLICILLEKKGNEKSELSHFFTGCEVSQEISVSQQKFHIKLQVPSSEGMTDLVLKCDTVSQGGIVNLK